MRDLYLPADLQQLISNQEYTTDSVGMSGSKILLFSDKVLKIQPFTPEIQHELDIMRWLRGKLPVPECLYHLTENETSYLLMSRIPGKMSCDDEFMQNPQQLTALLAGALRQLWQTDISDCPVSSTLSKKLEAARLRVESGAVDIEDCEPETFGENGFADPLELLEWLCANRPPEEPVFSHGDFCLPNVFIENGNISGFIDLGRAGTADRWQDIALCFRSLKHNFGGRYTKKIYENYDPSCLFEALGIEPDWDRINYYILLDELF